MIPSTELHRVIIGIGLTAHAHAVILRGRVAADTLSSLYSESAGSREASAKSRKYACDDGISAAIGTLGQTLQKQRDSRGIAQTRTAGHVCTC
jgi:hypothetical protein